MWVLYSFSYTTRYTALYYRDIDVIKPGCTVPMISFSTLYWLSMTLIVVCLFTAFWGSYMYSLKVNMTPQQRTDRLKVVVVTFLSLISMRSLTLSLRALKCVDVDGEKFLMMEQSLTCYGEHHLSFALLSMFLIGFTLFLLPLYLVYTLREYEQAVDKRVYALNEKSPMHGADDDGVVDADVEERAAEKKKPSAPEFVTGIRHFARKYTPRFYFLAIAPLYISATIAVVTVATEDRFARIVAPGIVVGLYACVIIYINPFITHVALINNILRSLLFVIVSLVLLVAMEEEEGDIAAKITWISVFAVFTTVILALSVHSLLRVWRKRVVRIHAGPAQDEDGDARVRGSSSSTKPVPVVAREQDGLEEEKTHPFALPGQLSPLPNRPAAAPFASSASLPKQGTL
jgi:hypothetical protein